MKLQRDIFLIVALLCHLQATAEADKSADNGTPETYDKNLIQVVDDSVISRFACGGGGGGLHLFFILELMNSLSKFLPSPKTTHIIST